MPGMTLRQLLEDEGENASTLRVGKGEVNLRTISPDLATGEMLDLMVQLASINTDSLSLELAADTLSIQATLVTKLVRWWDVIDETGHAVPLTVPEVKKLPKKFLRMVIDHVTSGAAWEQAQAGESGPGKRMSEDSGDTSSPQARLATSPTGIPTSRPQIVSIAHRGTSSPAKTRQGTGNGGQARHSSPSRQKTTPGKGPSSRSKA